jgi:hypothetical protein
MSVCAESLSCGLIAAGLAAVGCGSARTEIVVVVHSDLAAGSALAAIEIQGREPPGSPLAGAQLFDPSPCTQLGAAPPAVRPPAVLGVALAEGSRQTRGTLSALGFADPACAQGAVVSQSATVDFAPRQTLLLELHLAAACVGHACGFGQTCRAGAACQDDALGPLAPFDPAALPGDPLDGAALPEQVDGG